MAVEMELETISQGRTDAQAQRPDCDGSRSGEYWKR